MELARGQRNCDDPYLNLREDILKLKSYDSAEESMKATIPRCTKKGCPSECITRAGAAPIVFLACFFALIIPLLDSIGMGVHSSFSLEVAKITLMTGIIVMVGVGSVFIGCLRRHENWAACLLDSFGIPGIATAFIYASKGMSL
jgi:hypothetical protein